MAKQNRKPKARYFLTQFERTLRKALVDDVLTTGLDPLQIAKEFAEEYGKYIDFILNYIKSPSFRWIQLAKFAYLGWVLSNLESSSISEMIEETVEEEKEDVQRNPEPEYI